VLDFIVSSWPLAADDSARSAVCATVRSRETF